MKYLQEIPRKCSPTPPSTTPSIIQPSLTRLRWLTDFPLPCSMNRTKEPREPRCISPGWNTQVWSFIDLPHSDFNISLLQVVLEKIFLNMTIFLTWSWSWIQRVKYLLDNKNNYSNHLFNLVVIFYSIFQVRFMYGMTCLLTSDQTWVSSLSTLRPVSRMWSPRLRTPWRRASMLAWDEVRKVFIGPVASCRHIDRSLIKTEEFLDLAWSPKALKTQNSTILSLHLSHKLKTPRCPWNLNQSQPKLQQWYLLLNLHQRLCLNLWNQRHLWRRELLIWSVRAAFLTVLGIVWSNRGKQNTLLNQNQASTQSSHQILWKLLISSQLHIPTTKETSSLRSPAPPWSPKQKQYLKMAETTLFLLENPKPFHPFLWPQQKSPPPPPVPPHLQFLRGKAARVFWPRTRVWTRWTTVAWSQPPVLPS